MAAAGPHPAAAPDPVSLADGAVHIWRVDLGAGPVGVAPLADEERRAEERRDETGRAHFLASRAWLRVIVGRYLGTDAAAVRFEVGRRGKPSVVGGDGVAFSLSRSAGVALIAVTGGPSVGVDIEWVRDDADHSRLAEHFFSPVEAEALRSTAEPARRDEFFRLWVRKEAVVKASGAGLGDGIAHLDVRGDRVGRWSVTSLDAGAGFAAAVAVNGAMGPCSTWSLPPAG